MTTLNKFKVGDREKNELLGALAPMKKAIVTSPMAAGPDGAMALPLEITMNTSRRGQKCNRMVAGAACMAALLSAPAC